MRPLAACVLVAAAMVALAPSAYGYCRTTTTPQPVGYDPVASGCWAQGTPLAWTAGRVGYSIAAGASRQVNLADARRVAKVAFDAWNHAPCAGGPPDLQVYDAGPSDAPTGDAIVFRDDVWPYDDPNNTLALTTVTYAVDSALIFDAQIEINSHDHLLSAEEPPPDGVFRLRAILTHEAGHFFGIAHATDPRAVMYAHYRSAAVDLTPDDVVAVCTVYSPPPRAGCACGVQAAPAARAWPSLAVALLVLLYVRHHHDRARIHGSGRR
jgi:hypothetical protein